MKDLKKELGNIALNGEPKSIEDLDTLYRFMNGNGWHNELEKVSFNKFAEAYISELESVILNQDTCYDECTEKQEICLEELKSWLYEHNKYVVIVEEHNNDGTSQPSSEERFGTLEQAKEHFKTLLNNALYNNYDVSIATAGKNGIEDWLESNRDEYDVIKYIQQYGLSKDEVMFYINHSRAYKKFDDFKNNALNFEKHIIGSFAEDLSEEEIDEVLWTIFMVTRYD